MTPPFPTLALLLQPAAAGPTQEARGGNLQPHEAQLANSALRDRSLMPRLQKVLDRLVPAVRCAAARHAAVASAPHPTPPPHPAAFPAEFS